MTAFTLRETDDLNKLLKNTKTGSDILVSIDFNKFKSDTHYIFKKDDCKKGFLIKNSQVFFELGYKDDQVYLKSLLMGVDIATN